MAEVVRTGELTWTASGAGAPPGTVRAWLRPDQRCSLFFGDGAARWYDPLLDAALADLDRDVYLEADAADADLLRVLDRRGFTINRREYRCLVPTDPARTGLVATPLPAGLAAISAADADLDRWRELDDRLRQDVPGSDGWHNDPAWFLEQTFGGSAFDRDTYLLAVDGTEYVGLVRVWCDPDQPRLGLIAVLPGYRRRGLARALLGRVLGVLHRRGEAQVGCEIDQTNLASNALLGGLGARRTGTTLELLHRRPPR